MRQNPKDYFILKNILCLVVIIFTYYFCSAFIPKVLVDNIALGSYIYTSLSFSFILLSLTFFLLKKERGSNQIVIWKRLRIGKIFSKELLKSIGLLAILIVFSSFYNKLLDYTELGNNFSLVTPPQIGNYKFVSLSKVLTILGFLSAIIAEELFWRGYLLPLQEKKFGNKAWILNGIMFSLSHLILFNPLRGLIIALGYAFLGSKYKNTAIIIVLHLIYNLFIIILR